MREIDVRRVTEDGAAKIAAVFWVIYEKPQGGFAPPPIGARFKRTSNDPNSTKVKKKTKNRDPMVGSVPVHF